MKKHYIFYEKNFLPLILITVFITACKKDDNKTNDQLLKQKLVEVGKWECYGSYGLFKNYLTSDKIDTGFAPYMEGICYETYLEHTYSIDCNHINNEPYQIKNDSLITEYSKHHISFKGDSCMHTSAWTWNGSRYAQAIYVLYPKGTKKLPK